MGVKRTANSNGYNINNPDLHITPSLSSMIGTPKGISSSEWMKTPRFEGTCVLIIWTIREIVSSIL